MAIDIRQFHQTFFDESQESLVTMESALLQMERQLAAPGNRESSPEDLNTIFRVVHSIKGGSATFGFGWLTDFSHLLETLLEDLRAGRHHIDRATVNLLLRAVDCLRILLVSARTDSPVSKSAIDQVSAEIEALHEYPAGAGTVDAAARVAYEIRDWHIRFFPRPGLFASGNDPLRLLRELAGLGELHVAVERARLPAWDALNPEMCYLGWNLKLSGALTRDAISEIFSWVTEECDLDVAPAAAPPTSAPTAVTEAAPDQVRAHGTSLRVSTHKMDALVDIVGELVITQTMLNETASQFGPEDLPPRLLAGLGQLERNLRELQENVMRIRMLPIGFVFSRLPRLVRDVGEQLGKKVELRIKGEATELDKTVIERISDPLLHMVRNSLDHGIETPAERLASGKPELGHIRLEAYQRGGNVIIEIEDDGRGLVQDKILARAVERGLVATGAKLSAEQITELIFMPGFTTTDSVSDLSGRGVGLDVVRNNIYALGGNVEVSSQAGRGTHFIIRLPLTLAILDGLGVLVGNQPYIVPLANITESLRLAPEQIRALPGGEEIFSFRQGYVPLVRLPRLFQAEARDNADAGIVVVVEANGRQAGLFVDDLLGQQQVVIKSIESHYRRVDGIAAATILGDGTVAFILDIAGLVRAASAPARSDLAPGAGRVAPLAAFAPGATVH